MSCHKLLQSHLLCHFHYLNQSCTYLVAVCPVSCCWPKFQSIFNPCKPLQQTTGKNQCQNIIFNNRTGPSFLELNWCKKNSFSFLKRYQIAWHSTVTLVVKIPLYLGWFASYSSLSNRAKVLYPVPHHNINFYWHCLHGAIRFFLSVAVRIRHSFTIACTIPSLWFQSLGRSSKH